MPATEEKDRTEKRDEESALPKREMDARISIRHWRETEQRKAQAMSALEQGADGHFRDQSAEELLDQWEHAAHEADRAFKGLGSTGHIPKHHQDRHREEIEQQAGRDGWFRGQRDMSAGDVNRRQQAHERARIELETQRAAISAEARRGGPISPAPGTEGHPPDQPVALSRFGDSVAVADPFAAGKPHAGENLTYQDASRTITDAPGLATRAPAETMTRGQEAEAERPSLREEAQMEQREVDQRGKLLQEAEKQGKAEAQGEHQVGGPAHGRVENKQAGYKQERRGARPEPEPGNKPPEKK